MNPKDIAALSRVPLHLLPAVTRIQGAMACADGAVKYGPYNWREKPIALLFYLGAMERHILRMMDGEDIDPKSGLRHEAHLIATAGIILDARECGTLIDDRPAKKGRASVLLEEYEAQRKLTTVNQDPTVGGVINVFAYWLCAIHGRTEAGLVPCCDRAGQITHEMEIIK
jgi:hypothetical protein